jgi:hypothetical protein
MRRPYLPVIILALGLFAPTLRAGLMIENRGMSGGVGVTQFLYDIVFSTAAGEEQIDPGDFVTAYDVGTPGPGATFVSATAAPNWTVATNLIGMNGPQTLPNDDPALLNVTFTYTGATPITTSGNFAGFSIVSTQGGFVIDDYTSRRTDASGPDAGTKIGEVGRVAVPAIPEPASLAIFAIGAAVMMRRRG